MLNPLFVGMLARLTETEEDISIMSRPMEEWTAEEMKRMSKKAEEFMGIQ